MALYASNFDGKKVSYTTDSVDCSDDANILLAAKKDSSIRLYKYAHTVEELFSAWNETYEKRLCGDVIFREDSQAYNIGVKPRQKKDLVDFTSDDKIVNRFEEILRHNNVSDKENAFNRLIALFNKRPPSSEMWIWELYGSISGIKLSFPLEGCLSNACKTNVLQKSL